MTQWPCSDSINLGHSPFASPSREQTWRAQHGARTRLSVEWKCLLSPWSMWHFWGTFVFNLRDDQKMPKELWTSACTGHSCEPGILPQSPNLWKSLKTCRFRGVNGNHGKCWDSTESGVLFTSHFQCLVTSLPSSSITARAEPADLKGNCHGFKLKKFPISNGAEDKIWKELRSVMKDLDTEFNKSYSHSLTNRKHFGCSS